MWKWALSLFGFALELVYVAGLDFSGYDSGDEDPKEYPQIPELGSAVLDGRASGEGFGPTTESISYATSYLDSYYPEETTAGYDESTHLASYPDREEPTVPTPIVVTPVTPLRGNKDLSPAPEGPQKAEVVDLLEGVRLLSDTGFKIVRGSQRGLTAYRLQAGITRKTRLVLPYGLPQEFSIVSTFRIRHSSSAWDLCAITDGDGADQFRLRFFGQTYGVEVFYTGAAEGDTVALLKSADEMFDGGWHSVVLSAQRGQIVLYVDCQWIDTATVNYCRPIRADGETVLIRRMKEDSAMVVEMQQLQLYMRDLVMNETCCEIPGWGDGGGADPDGGSGAPGEKVAEGCPGIPGLSGIPGNDGQKGERGKLGTGLPEPDGHQGVKGFPGYHAVSRDDYPGISGPPAHSELPGHPRSSGPPGHPGLCVTKDCDAYIPTPLVQQELVKGPTL